MTPLFTNGMAKVLDTAQRANLLDDVARHYAAQRANEARRKAMRKARAKRMTFKLDAMGVYQIGEKP
jgi:SOS response regulatory protein OraA/RecX